MNSERPGYVPAGFVPLLAAIAQRAGRRDPAALKRARAAMLQELGDGKIRAVVLSETTGSLVEVEVQFWRTGEGAHAISTGRVELLPGSPALPITLRLLHFVAGPCFVRSADVHALAPAKRAATRRAITPKVPDSTIKAFIVAQDWTDRTRPPRDDVERLVCGNLGCKRDQVRRIVAEMKAAAGKREKGRPGGRKKPASAPLRGGKPGRDG